MEISIQHQETRLQHLFEVNDANNLTSGEVKIICDTMGVFALLINGKYYENEH